MQIEELDAETAEELLRGHIRDLTTGTGVAEEAARDAGLHDLADRINTAHLAFADAETQLEAIIAEAKAEEEAKEELAAD